MSHGCRGYQLSRRAVLGASAGTFLGLNVRNLVALAGTDRKPTAEHVILFWNGGGMSHLDTWDPKPGRPTQGEFEPIKTSADGIQISEIFPQVAKQMHHCAIIRSIAGTNGDHGRATYELQTSYPQNPALVHPGMGSFVVNESQKNGDLPAYISIGGMAPRAGYLGQRCEAYYIGLPGERDPYLAFPDGIHHAQGVDAAHAQAVALGTTVNGIAQNEDVDYFSVDLAQGRDIGRCDFPDPAASRQVQTAAHKCYCRLPLFVTW